MYKYWIKYCNEELFYCYFERLFVQCSCPKQGERTLFRWETSRKMVIQKADMGRIILEWFLGNLIVVMKIVGSGSGMCPFVGFFISRVVEGYLRWSEARA